MTKSTGAKAKANPTTTTNWRELIKVHPAAATVRLMTPEELETLREDIKTNGLRVPIVTWFDKEGQEWLFQRPKPNITKTSNSAGL